MKTREVVFYSEGAKMVGDIYLPDDYKEGEKRPAVLCNSGWTGVNKCYPALFARALTARGFVCMGFDYRGFKPSENVHPCLPKYTTLETEVEDVANAFTFMQIQPCPMNILFLSLFFRLYQYLICLPQVPKSYPTQQSLYCRNNISHRKPIFHHLYDQFLL